MANANVQIYPLTKKALEHIIKKRKERGVSANKTIIVEELILQEAKKENFNDPKKNAP